MRLLEAFLTCHKEGFKNVYRKIVKQVLETDFLACLLIVGHISPSIVRIRSESNSSLSESSQSRI